MFSTAAGQTAMDGTGRNSPFAQAFLKYLEAPGDISSTIKQITGETKRLTNGIQVPFVYSNLDLDFAFNPSAAASKPTSSSTEGLSFGNVKPGSLEVRAVSAGTVEINGQKAAIPAGGVLPIENVVPGDYQVKMSYGGGQSETREVRVESGGLAKVSFSYDGTSFKLDDLPPGCKATLGEADLDYSQLGAGGAQVEPGTYDLTVRSPAGQKWNRKGITIENGRKYEFKFGSLTAVVPERTIKMTGRTDEWDGLAPLLRGKDSIDTRLQSISGPLGSQITKVWLARDKDNLYLRIDLDGEALFNIRGADYAFGFRPQGSTVNDQIDPGVFVDKHGPVPGIYSHPTKSWSPVGSYKPLPSGFELKFPLKALAQSGIEEGTEYNLGIWVSLTRTTGVASQHYISNGVKIDFE